MQDSTTTLPIDIIRATQNDVHLIRDSWLKSYRSSVWVSGIPSEIYYPVHGNKVDALLSQSQVLIARYQKDPDQVYGWIAGRQYLEHLIVHYCYVKSTFRKLGIGRQLLNKLIHYAPLYEKIIATHRTWSHAWLDSQLSIEYNPYLIDEIVRGAS